jgi:hypothetical protein
VACHGQSFGSAKDAIAVARGVFRGTTLGEAGLFTVRNLMFANVDSFVGVLSITQGAGGLRDIVGVGAFTASTRGSVLVSTVQVLDDKEGIPNTLSRSVSEGRRIADSGAPLRPLPSPQMEASGSEDARLAGR